METIGERIRKARNDKGLTLDDLAKCIDSTRQTIYKYENNIITNIPSDNIEKIAVLLDVSPIWLMGWSSNIKSGFDGIMKDGKGTDEPSIISIKVPLYSPICCGNGGFTDDNIIDYISLPSNMLNPHADYFSQIANGDSMVGAGINSGDILVFEKTGHCDSGQIGCFCIDDNDAMCKKYRITNDNQIMLMPANEKYDPILIDVQNDHFRCIGVLAYSVHSFK